MGIIIILMFVIIISIFLMIVNERSLIEIFLLIITICVTFYTFHHLYSVETINENIRRSTLELLK